VNIKPTELTSTDRMYLTRLVYDPGFTVLKALMEKRVAAATVAILEVQPTDPDRNKKILALQTVAYAVNTFCNDLFKDVQWQVASEMQEEETEPEETAKQKEFREALVRVGILSMENNNGTADSSGTND
jgi:hypothetical protein